LQKCLAIGKGRCNLLPLLQSVLGYSVELELSDPSSSLLLICLIEPQRVNELDRRFELLNKRRECRRSSRPDTGKLELRFVVRAYKILSLGLPTRESQKDFNFHDIIIIIIIEFTFRSLSLTLLTPSVPAAHLSFRFSRILKI